MLCQAVFTVVAGADGRCAVSQQPRPGADESVDGFVGAVQEFCMPPASSRALRMFSTRAEAVKHACALSAPAQQWSFCLTDNAGSRHYGHTIVFDGDVRAQNQQFTLGPMSVCVLSRTAHFAFFGKLLRALLDSARRHSATRGAPLALDYFARQLTRAIPCPARDTTLTLRIDGSASPPLTWRSGVVHPLDSCSASAAAACGASLTELFSRLSVADVLTIVAHLVTDGKVLLHCADRGDLTPLATALQALCFPLLPQCTFVPYMPTKLARTLLQAPTPFLFGIESERDGTLPLAVRKAIARLTAGDAEFALLVVDLSPRPAGHTRVVLRTMAADRSAAAAAARSSDSGGAAAAFASAPSRAAQRARQRALHPPGSTDFRQPSTVLAATLRAELEEDLRSAITWGPDGALELLRRAPGAAESHKACAAAQSLFLRFWACVLAPGDADALEGAAATWLDDSITVCHWRHRYGLWGELADAEALAVVKRDASTAAARAAAAASAAAVDATADVALTAMERHAYPAVLAALRVATYFCGATAEGRAAARAEAADGVAAAENVWQHLPSGMDAEERLHHRYFCHVAAACQRAVRAARGVSTPAAPRTALCGAPGSLEQQLCAALAAPHLAFGRKGATRAEQRTLFAFAKHPDNKRGRGGLRAGASEAVARFTSARARATHARCSDAFSDDESDDCSSVSDGDSHDAEIEELERAEEAREGGGERGRVAAAAAAVGPFGLSASERDAEQRLVAWLARTERRATGGGDAAESRRRSRRLTRAGWDATRVEATLRRAKRRTDPRYMSWVASTIDEDEPQLSLAVARRLRDAKRRIEGTKREFKALRADVVRTLNGDMRTLLAEAHTLVSKRRALVSDARQRRAIERELKTGNVRVMCRVRGGGLLKGEQRDQGRRGASSAGREGHVLVQPRSERTIRVAKQGEWEHFEMDKVFASDASQADVFAQIAPLVRRAAMGFNACVMAYGSTGSGKSYTMLGRSGGASSSSCGADAGEAAAHAGIAPRMVDMLFAQLSAAHSNAGSSFSIVLSVVEVYDEKMRDLLRDEAAAVAAAAGGTKSARARAGSTEKLRLQCKKDSFDVVGASKLALRDAAHAAALIEQATLQRVTRDNGVNDVSSRSHLVVIFRCVVDASAVEGTEAAGCVVEVTSSTAFKLMLVDLAGSERMSTSTASSSSSSSSSSVASASAASRGDGATATTERECRQINKSLSALGDVVAALSKKKSGRHVPYRNSTLTMLLSDCLGGDSCSVAIVNLSPSAARVDDSRRALAFGAMLRRVKNSSKQHRNVVVNSKTEERAKSAAKEARGELKKAQKELRAAQRREKSAVADMRKLSSAKRDELVRYQKVQEQNNALVETNEKLISKLLQAQKVEAELREALAAQKSRSAATRAAEVAQRARARSVEIAEAKKREAKLKEKVRALAARNKRLKRSHERSTAVAKAYTPAKVVLQAAEASGVRYSPQRAARRAPRAAIDRENGGGGHASTTNAARRGGATVPRFSQPTLGSARKTRSQQLSVTDTGRKRARKRVAKSAQGRAVGSSGTPVKRGWLGSLLG